MRLIKNVFLLGKERCNLLSDLREQAINLPRSERGG